MMRIQLALVVPRDAVSVPMARHTVSAALHGAQVDPDCLAEVELALTEACTQVIRHAGHDRNFEVLINLDDDRLTMDVLDLGTGFGRRPTATAELPEHQAERGHGLALMQALSDRAVFDGVTGEGASVHLVKNLRWPQPTPTVPTAGQARSTAATLANPLGDSSTPTGA